ncbi:MAG TPA: NifU family protein [Thermoanaerobaculia bacterium]|jgi:Fe-S cluster biogenesis protein NfuA
MGGNLRAVGDRIEGLLAELPAIADPRARETAEELVRSLLELYGGGLERMMEIVYDSPAGGELLSRFAADDLVASLLLLHDLHPEDTESRVLRALDGVRPYLGSHGGDVQLLGIADGVVRLRLEGSCHGCPSSAVTMKLAIEKAIAEAAPEVVGIEVEGVADPASPAEPLVQIGLKCPSEIEGYSHG